MDTKFQNQGLPPVVPPGLPPDPPPPVAPAEPVPLPKATGAEPPPLPPSPKPASPHPLFEKPVTVAPEAKSEQPTVKSEQRKFPKGVIAGIAALVFLVVGGLVIIPNRIARDPDWGYIGIAAGNGCSNGLCPVRSADGKTTYGYIKTDTGNPIVGNYQDVLDARANLVIDNLEDDQQKIQEAPSVKVENNQVVRNEDTGRVETTDGGQIPTYEEVKTHLQENKLANTQENVNQVVEQVNSGSSGTPADSSSSDAASAGGDAAGCAAFHGNDDAVRRCLVEADTGKYRTGDCGPLSDEECLALGTPVYCSGPQSGMESGRGGEFLTCGASSANNCGQVDIYAPEDVENGVSKPGAQPKGFIIDKSGCGGQPQVTNDAAPPREIPSLQEPPPGTAATPTPVTVNAFCSSLVGQISDGAGGWTTKTDAEFSAAARPGDRVRFVCTGAKNRGRFTKSAFFINSVLHIDDVVKLAEDQYSVEYAIPAAGALKVESVLLHDSKGWVD